jgi:uncharacterized protein YcfJ
MSATPNPSSTLAAGSVAERLRRMYPLAIAIGAVCLIAAVPFIVTHTGRPGANANADASAPGATLTSSAPAPVGPLTSSAPAPALAPVCRECGEVVNIRTSRKEGEGSGVGAVAGGVVGGVLGHQVGAGRGKEAMTVLGAIGGAFGGNQVEKQVKAKTLYLVDIRMADGSARTITENAPPNLAVGAQVRVTGNTIAPR